MANVKAVSHIVTISIIVVILGISAVGLYFYSLSSHSVAQANTVTLQSFSLNPSTSNLTGNVKVNSNSPLVRMSLYMNGTFMGSFNYSNHNGMMSTMMGGYPYAYSMMYSWYPGTMPMMKNFQFMSNRTYMVTMMATFEDDTTCNATTFIHP
jgi:hypothetical protein